MLFAIVVVKSGEKGRGEGASLRVVPASKIHNTTALAPHAEQMRLWDRVRRWCRHPRLSLYLYQRRHDRAQEDARKEKRLDKHNLHQRYPGVTDFLLSQQSLVVSEHVGPPQAHH